MTVPTVGLDDNACCQEYAALSASRRNLLRGALVAGTTTIIGDAVMTTASALPGRTSRAVLVVLSLRGVVDGMSLVVPHGDPVYYEARPKIAIPQDQLLAADGFFGMHPALSPLLPLDSPCRDRRGRRPGGCPRRSGVQGVRPRVRSSSSRFQA